MFQVQQKKKVKKFSCKLCGKKQSLQKLYGQSYKAKDLRPLVQDYNMNEGSKREIEEEKKRTRSANGDEEETLDSYLSSGNSENVKSRIQEGLENSVWNDFKYQDSESEGSDIDSEGDSGVTLNFDAYATLSGNKRRQTRRNRFASKKKKLADNPTSTARPNTYSNKPKICPVKKTNVLDAPTETQILRKQNTSCTSAQRNTMGLGAQQLKKVHSPYKSQISDAPRLSKDTIKKPEPKTLEPKKPNPLPSNSVWAKFQYDDSQSEESEEED